MYAVGNIEAIVVHSDTCIVSRYDNRIGWYYIQYGRDMKSCKRMDRSMMMNYKNNIVLDESFYEHVYGGRCFIDFDPQRYDFIIIIENDDIYHFSFRVNGQRAKHCTPELILNRIQEIYTQQLYNRATNWYEEYVHECIGRRNI